MAFWCDVSSDGNPSVIHWSIWRSDSMNLENENSFDFSSYFHFSIFSLRKLSEHSDKYDTNADANRVLNNKVFKLDDSSFTFKNNVK